jgi:ribosomal protein S18 acetylase RimI-like enzyme
MDPDEFTDDQGLSVRPLPDCSDIRKVTGDHVPKVAQALAAAFYDDPVMSWVIPDDDRRMERLARLFTLYVRRIWLPQDESYTTDRVAGAALWMPPGTSKMGIFEQLRLMPAMIRAMGWDLPRLMTVLAATEKKHPHDDHYYLPVIGIAPQWQGHGFGNHLMQPVLARCDERRLPAYLESTNPRNQTLYERNGFKGIDEVQVKDCPPLLRMWREPAV